MTVLITGGAGYIGSHMVHALCAAGERVVVLDNLSTGFDWAVAKGVPLVIADVGEQSRVAALISEHAIDAIIHFAASVVVPDSVRESATAMGFKRWRQVLQVEVPLAVPVIMTGLRIATVSTVALVTVGVLWRFKKVPEPAIVVVAALIGLVVQPLLTRS